MVTCTLSVLLSSTARPVGRGLPEAVRLCDVETLEGCGDGLSCLLESALSVLKLSRAFADVRDGRNGFSCAAAPFMPKGESLAEEEDIVPPQSPASVASYVVCCGDRDVWLQGCVSPGALYHRPLRRASPPSTYTDRVFGGERVYPTVPYPSGSRCTITPELTLIQVWTSARDHAAQGSS